MLPRPTVFQLTSLGVIRRAAHAFYARLGYADTGRRFARALADGDRHGRTTRA